MVHRQLKVVVEQPIWRDGDQTIQSDHAKVLAQTMCGMDTHDARAKYEDEENNLRCVNYFYDTDGIESVGQALPDTLPNTSSGAKHTSSGGT
jgi:hypothetical protein